MVFYICTCRFYEYCDNSNIALDIDRVLTVTLELLFMPTTRSNVLQQCSGAMTVWLFSVIEIIKSVSPTSAVGWKPAQLNGLPR